MTTVLQFYNSEIMDYGYMNSPATWLGWHVEHKRGADNSTKLPCHYDT